MLRLSLALLVLCATFNGVHGGQPASAWASRTIYQLLTDRFGGTTAPCSNLNDYCGGTFDGIVDHLDYIAGMGFDAIWISPPVENTPGGYHGYWAKDFNSINPYFGTAQDLIDFVEAAHKMDIWVMVDIVANHVGPVGTNFTGITPYTYDGDYHPQCQVTNYVCFQNETYVCRLSDLPDLDQSNETVQNDLYEWISDLMTTYNFDGIRADTVMYINPTFWAGFQEAADAYIVGEVWSDVSCCIAYQEQSIDGILSYPMYYTLRSVFQSGQSMNQIQDQVQAYQGFPNASLLGTFVDNQDNPRFLYENTDLIPQYMNALAYVLLSDGIPIIYYGTEQYFDGGVDPANREILWPTGYNTSTPMYEFLTTVVGVRKTNQVWSQPQVQRYSDDNFYAFTRGNVFVALTNTLSTVEETITYQPYSDGTVICNVFDSSDCLTVDNGQFTVQLGLGLPKIYLPQSS